MDRQADYSIKPPKNVCFPGALKWFVYERVENFVGKCISCLFHGVYKYNGCQMQTKGS